MVTTKLDGEGAHARFVYESEVSEDTREDVSIAETEVMADYHGLTPVSFTIEVLPANERLSIHDGELTVYRRWEASGSWHGTTSDTLREVGLTRTALEREKRSGIDPMELPAAAAWRRSLTPLDASAEPLGYHSYIDHEVGIDRAFAVMRLFVPEFDELRGCVLIRGTGSYSPQSFEQWWSTLDGNVPAIENVINHLHLWDLFTALAEGPIIEEALAEFGRSLVLTWQAALARDFPDRQFVVELYDDYGPTVGFYSIPNHVADL